MTTFVPNPGNQAFRTHLLPGRRKLEVAARARSHRVHELSLLHCRVSSVLVTSSTDLYRGLRDSRISGADAKMIGPFEIACDMWSNRIDPTKHLSEKAPRTPRLTARRRVLCSMQSRARPEHCKLTSAQVPFQETLFTVIGRVQAKAKLSVINARCHKAGLQSCRS